MIPATYPDLDVAALLERMTMAELVRQSGIVRRRLERRKTTGLTLEEADRCAVAIGRHPSELWPCWYDLCEQVRRARNTAATRRYRATKKGREATRRANQAHYRRASDYYKKQSALWRAENAERVLAAGRAYHARRDVERRRQINRESSRRYREKKRAA